MDKAKQFGFYVDFLEQFISPANMIPRNLAKDAIARAEEIIKEYQPLRQEGDLPSLLITFENHYNEVLKSIEKDEELSIINRIIK